MDHKEAVELLAAYLDNEIASKERQELETHVAQCQRCRKELETLKRAQAALRSVLKSSAADVDPPARAWQQLQPGLESYRPSLLFLFRERKWRIVGTIVILVILAVLAVLWGTGVLPGLR